DRAQPDRAQPDRAQPRQAQPRQAQPGPAVRSPSQPDRPAQWPSALPGDPTSTFPSRPTTSTPSWMTPHSTRDQPSKPRLWGDVMLALLALVLLGVPSLLFVTDSFTSEFYLFSLQE